MEPIIALAAFLLLAVTSWFWGVDSRDDNVSLWKAPSSRRSF